MLQVAVTGQTSTTCFASCSAILLFVRINATAFTKYLSCMTAGMHACDWLIIQILRGKLQLEVHIKADLRLAVNV
jgi:hypothetical protein